MTVKGRDEEDEQGGVRLGLHRLRFHVGLFSDRSIKQNPTNLKNIHILPENISISSLTSSVTFIPSKKQVEYPTLFHGFIIIHLI